MYIYILYNICIYILYNICIYIIFNRKFNNTSISFWGSVISPQRFFFRNIATPRPQQSPGPLPRMVGMAVVVSKICQQTVL